MKQIQKTRLHCLPKRCMGHEFGSNFIAVNVEKKKSYTITELSLKSKISPVFLEKNKILLCMAITTLFMLLFGDSVLGPVHRNYLPSICGQIRNKPIYPVFMCHSNHENFLSIKDTRSSEAGAMGRLVNETKKWFIM